jgi:hypothetical protein
MMKKITLLGLSFLAWSFQAQVGIGTTAPATRLHIQNTNTMGVNDSPASTTAPSLYIYNNNASSSAAHAVASLRTNGAGSGNPYISWDLTSVQGFSMGLDNSTDQLIISNNWNFNNSTNDKKLMIFNPTGQSRVIIPSQAGSFAAAWPQGWGGGLATFDITCASVYSNSVILQSDMRLKNSVKDLDLSFVNKFMSLRPVNYYWNEGKSEDKGLQYGFIAQEVAQIFPELVFTASDEMQTKSMNYQAFHAMSARMIQLQQAQLKNQQQEINELKSSLELLDARLQSLEKK